MKIEYVCNDRKHKTASVETREDGLTQVFFESGVEWCCDNYGEAVEALYNAGYDNWISEVLSMAKSYSA